MTETQPIRQLPELEDHQEWACDNEIKAQFSENIVFTTHEDA
ncbi:hypothetical protein [Acinetobacter variabilis]|nr:hypothetical protein [Acinetobacter variabilis]